MKSLGRPGSGWCRAAMVRVASAQLHKANNQQDDRGQDSDRYTTVHKTIKGSRTLHCMVYGGLYRARDHVLRELRAYPKVCGFLFLARDLYPH